MSSETSPKLVKDLKFSGKTIDLVRTEEKHYPSLQKILSDTKTMQHLLFMVKVESNGWTLKEIDERVTRLKNGDHLYFSILEKHSGDMIGSCSLKDVNLTHKNAEFGLIIHHPYWGKGIAAECHILVLDYAFSKLNLHRIHFQTTTDNMAMQKFFDLSGIQKESISKEIFYENGKFKDSVVYAVFENEWPSVKMKLQEKLERQIDQKNSA